MGTQWLSQVPEKCDICEMKIKDTFIDGRTKIGPWACMCQTCHKRHGAGLGLGVGQKFKRQDDGRWICNKKDTK